MNKETIIEAFSSAQQNARNEALKNFKNSMPAENATIEDVHAAEVETVLDYVDSLVLNTINNLLAD